MQADAACATPGFYGAPVSGVGLAPSSTLLAIARRISFASPEKRAQRAAFFTPATSAPLAQLRVREGKPKKPSAFRGEANATLTRRSKHYPYHNRTGIDPILVPVRIVFTALAVRGGFFWPLAPQHASACEGCGGGRAMNASHRRALLSACEAMGSWPQRSAGRFLREGASAARTAQHLKNPE